MKRKRLDHLDSDLAAALEVVGEWWTLLVVQALFDGHSRFESIQRELQTARNILTDRLRTLEAAGVVERRAYQDKPTRHEYHLTEMGLDLSHSLAALSNWGNKWTNGRRGPQAS